MTVGKDNYKFATVHANGGHPYASATSVEFSPYTTKIAGFKINLTGTGFSIAASVSIKQTDGHIKQTYGLRRHITHTDVCSLCATRNRMRAPFAPPIFRTYEKYL